MRFCGKVSCDYDYVPIWHIYKCVWCGVECWMDGKWWRVRWWWCWPKYQMTIHYQCERTFPNAFHSHCLICVRVHGFPIEQPDLVSRSKGIRAHLSWHLNDRQKISVNQAGFIFSLFLRGKQTFSAPFPRSLESDMTIKRRRIFDYHTTKIKTIFRLMFTSFLWLLWVLQWILTRKVDANIMRIFVSRKEIDRSFHFAYSRTRIGNNSNHTSG